MDLAKVAASWSKDPSTKIGAVAIGEKGQVLCTGYNGFPRGIDDNLTRYYNRDLKYKMVVHAEQNAIYNATYNGVSLNGSTMYVHGLPCCSDCAKGIIQVGVKRVIMSTPATPDRWKDSWQLTETMFKEAGVSYDFI